MNITPYEELAAALDRLPNGFPATPERVELKILARIFTAEEAWLAARLGRKMESYEEIAARLGLPPAEVRLRLLQLARRGLVWSNWSRSPSFRLAPFIVGIYEAQVDQMDAELASLVEAYMQAGGAAGIMAPVPALHRVVPAQGSVKQEWVLPYDDVRAMLLNARSFNSQDCVCRVEQEHLGRKCKFPNGLCMNFSSAERAPRPGDLTQAEALAMLDRAEELGLVHTVSNSIAGVSYICNCCGCCCGILRGITAFGLTSSVARASYTAVVDPDLCLGCEICVDRCQVGAISVPDGLLAVVDAARCIGCGLCATGCPNGSIQMEPIPLDEVIAPPADYEAWEEERLRNRGLM